MTAPSPFRRRRISVFVLFLAVAMIVLVSQELIKRLQPWRMADRGDCIVVALEDQAWINRCTEPVNLAWCIEPEAPGMPSLCRQRALAAAEVFDGWREDFTVQFSEGPVKGVWRHACALPYRPVKRPDFMNPGRDAKACARPQSSG